MDIEPLIAMNFVGHVADSSRDYLCITISTTAIERECVFLLLGCSLERKGSKFGRKERKPVSFIVQLLLLPPKMSKF